MSSISGQEARNGSKVALVAVVATLAIFAVSCGGSSPASAPTGTAVATASETAAIASPTAPAATREPATAATPIPSPTEAAAAGGDPRYTDDRSSALALLRSYVNALNRHEYLRAYSYWEPEAAATDLPAFPRI